MKIVFITVFIFFMQLMSAAQQPVMVQGIIRDASNGSPIESATIMQTPNRQSVRSAPDGSFSINITGLPATLYFSAVGYKTVSMLLNNDTHLPLTVILSRNMQQMDTITVYNTGYQSVSKQTATGSFTQLENKVLNLQVGSNILSRLESVAGSVAFNKKNNRSPAITVRGISTINGPTSPLIVLDDFPFEGDINAIDPNIVESITILKDAAAAAIWGTKAGNGVIIINTKKAKYGQPLTVTFNSNIQVYARPDVFYNKPIATTDYIDMEQWLYGKGYFNSAISDPYHPAISPVIEILDRQANGIITPADAASQIDAFRNKDIRNDYSKLIYTNAVNQQYAINVSGGTANSNWLVAGGYTGNISNLSDKYRRLNARLLTTFKPVKNLNITAGLYFTNTTSHTGKEGYPQQRYVYPYSSLLDENGDPVPAARNFRLGYTDTATAGKLPDWNYYPLDNYKYVYTNTQAANLLADLGMQYRITKSLAFDFKYRYEMQISKNEAIQEEQSYQARYTTNQFAQINPVTGVVTYKVPKGGILDAADNQLAANNVRAQLNYINDYKNHKISVITGAELRETHTASSASKIYGYNPANLTSVSVDYTNQYPIFPYGDLANIPGEPTALNEQLKRFVSFYANAAYTFRDKYSLTVSGRRDASNLFGVNTNSKWTPLWSAGLAWDITKEKFFQSKMLPVLKLRASYGFTGNADNSRSSLVTLTYTGNSFITGFPITRINQFPNPGLRWEKVAITDIGFDFALKNNRISGSVDWYSKKGTDLFGFTQIDITAGLGQNSLITNVANMKAKGCDIILNTINTTGKLRFTSGLLFSYNTDKVTKAFISNTQAARFLSDGGSITAVQGKPVHSIVSFKWAGLEHSTGNPQGYLNGVISQDYGAITGAGTSIAGLEFSGPALPQFFGSLSNGIAWKRLELNFNISYKFGYYFKRTALNYGNLFAGADKKSTSDYAVRWQQPGDEQFTDVPSMIYPSNGNRDYFYSSSSALVEKGDHIRFQFINLSYAYPLQKGKINSGSNILFYLNISNLGIIWRANKKGIDPDYALTAIPPAKAWAFGIKLTLR